MVMTSREWFVREGTLRKIGNVVFVASLGSTWGEVDFGDSLLGRIFDGLTPVVPWYVDFSVERQKVVTYAAIKHALFLG